MYSSAFLTMKVSLSVKHTRIFLRSFGFYVMPIALLKSLQRTVFFKVRH
jgi:hypothetical protein